MTASQLVQFLLSLPVFLMTSLSFADLPGLEAVPREVNLGDVDLYTANIDFKIKVKTQASVRPDLISTCGCMVVHEDTAYLDKDGYWIFTLTRFFGLDGGSDARKIEISANELKQTVLVKSNAVELGKINYSGLLRWNSSNRENEAKTVDILFNPALKVKSLKSEKVADEQFIATVERAEKDGSRWLISVRPKFWPMKPSLLPGSVILRADVNSKRVKPFTINCTVD